MTRRERFCCLCRQLVQLYGGHAVAHKLNNALRHKRSVNGDGEAVLYSSAGFMYNARGPAGATSPSFQDMVSLAVGANGDNNTLYGSGSLQTRLWRRTLPEAARLGVVPIVVGSNAPCSWQNRIVSS